MMHNCWDQIEQFTMMQTTWSCWGVGLAGAHLAWASICSREICSRTQSWQTVRKAMKLDSHAQEPNVDKRFQKAMKLDSHFPLPSRYVTNYPKRHVGALRLQATVKKRTQATVRTPFSCIQLHQMGCLSTPKMASQNIDKSEIDWVQNLIRPRLRCSLPHWCALPRVMQCDVVVMMMMMMMMIKQTIMPGALLRHCVAAKLNGLRDGFFLKWVISKKILKECTSDENGHTKDQTWQMIPTHLFMDLSSKASAAQTNQCTQMHKPSNEQCTNHPMHKPSNPRKKSK